MTKLCAAAVSLGLVAILSTNVTAAPLPASQLDDWCTTGDSDAMKAVCGVWFSGAIDAGLVYGTLLEDTGMALYCAPEDLTPNIAMRVWQRHVEENPETLVQPAVFGFFSAMSDAFPCD